MSSLKSKKKTESQLALDALIHTSKSITSALLFLLAYLWGLHLFLLIAISLPFIVFTFIAIQQKSFVILYRYFRKALKFKKVHNFFDEVGKAKVELPVKDFFDKQSPRKSWIRQRNSDEKNGSSLKSPISLQNSADDRILAPVTILPPKQQEEYEERPNQQSLSAQTQADKKKYQQMYLKIREQYKKSFEQICGKQASRQEFQELVSKIRSFYLNRVSELLLMNRINLKQIKEQLQRHYQVHILQHQNSSHKPELVNVTLDDAISRLIQYENVKCFPWTDKMEWEASDVKSHYHKIERIARDRKEIDRFLAPYIPLNQKLREEIVEELERQMTQPSSLGSQLAYTVAEIHNDKLKQSKISEEYFIFKQGINSSPCLQILKIRIGSKLHLDLQLKRTSKIDIIACNPGDNNLWTLLTFAVQILKRKL